MTLDVLVAISCHSWPQYTIESVTSAVNQNPHQGFTDVLAVVDEGENAEQYEKMMADETFPLTAWLWPEGVTGVTESRNAAFRFAQQYGYDFVVPLDEDDILYPFFVDRTISWHRKSGAGVVYTDWAMFGDGVFGSKNKSRHGPFSSDKLRQGNFISACSLIATRVWQAVKERNGHGYDPGLETLGWEDYLFYREADALGFTFAYLPVPAFRYRCHSGTRTKTANKKTGQIVEYIREKMSRLYGQ